MARTSRWIHVLIAAAMVVAGVVGASSAVSAAPTARSAVPTASPVGPPDAPLTQVTTNVATSCGTVPITATVPTYVNAGRPFPVKLTTTPEFTPGPDQALTAYVSIAGGTKTNAAISLDTTAYFVAPWSSPEPTFRLSIAGFDVFNVESIDGPFFQNFCSADSQVELAAIPVLHNTPFSSATITATQQFGFYCIYHPSGIVSPSVRSASVTVPNQVHQGEPFTINGPDSVNVTGGVRSGNTVTPTGKVGDTVDFWNDSSYDEVIFGLPIVMCTQVDAPMHLASVPIVAR